MQKLLALTCVIFLSILIFSCGSGGGAPTSSISIAFESGTTCTNMQNGTTCGIVINYNTNGANSPTLGYTPNPLPQGITKSGDFYSQVTICQNSINSSATGTCYINFSYSAPNNPTTNVNIAFTLGGATSNTLNLTGS